MYKCDWIDEQKKNLYLRDTNIDWYGSGSPSCLNTKRLNTSLVSMYIKRIRTHFEEPIAVGIGMRLKRRPLVQQILAGRLVSRRRRCGGRGGCDHAGPTVRALFLRHVFQVGGRPALVHDPPFEHPVWRWHIATTTTNRPTQHSLENARRLSALSWSSRARRVDYLYVYIYIYWRCYRRDYFVKRGRQTGDV